MRAGRSAPARAGRPRRRGAKTARVGSTAATRRAEPSSGPAASVGPTSPARALFLGSPPLSSASSSSRRSTSRVDLRRRRERVERRGGGRARAPPRRARRPGSTSSRPASAASAFAHSRIVTSARWLVDADAHDEPRDRRVELVRHVDRRRAVAPPRASRPASSSCACDHSAAERRPGRRVNASRRRIDLGPRRRVGERLDVDLAGRSGRRSAAAARPPPRSSSRRAGSAAGATTETPSRSTTLTPSAAASSRTSVRWSSSRLISST